MADAIAPLDLAGSPHEIGVAHGRAHRTRIAAFLADRLCRMNAVLPAPTSLDALTPDIDAYLSCIEQHSSAHFRELVGLAEGAGITLREAGLLQLRRELVGYRTTRPAGDCTTFARTTPSGVVLAQTIDLHGDMTRELTVLRIVHRTTGRRVLLVSFTGLLGYVGINDRGLAVGINLVLGGHWGNGLPGYLLIRKLLDEAADPAAALALLRDLPRASSRALMLCGADRVINVEYVRDQLAFEGASELVHTNHFKLAPFVVRDALNVFARNGSLRRLSACQAGLARLSRSASDDDYLCLLSESPIFVRGSGDVRQECTVASLVARPADGTIVVRRADGATVRVALGNPNEKN